MNWLPEESVTKELSRVKESVIPNLHKDIIALAKDLKASEQISQRLVELGEKLDTYASHAFDCRPYRFVSGKCTCGLDELRAEIKKVKGQ